MNVVYIAYANGSKNGLGPADPGISIYRKVLGDGGNVVLEEQEIANWTGGEIDGEDGELDTDAAERQLDRLGWRPAEGWDDANDGQMVMEVEPWDDGRPVSGLPAFDVAELDNWAGDDERHMLKRDELVRAASAAGVNVRQIALHMGISRTTVYAILGG